MQCRCKRNFRDACAVAVDQDFLLGHSPALVVDGLPQLVRGSVEDTERVHAAVRAAFLAQCRRGFPPSRCCNSVPTGDART